MSTFTDFDRSDFDRSDFRDVHRAVYYETTVQSTIQQLVAAASRGWGPEDIAHVLGNDVRGLLFRAAPRVPSHVDSPALRKAWLRCPVASYQRLPIERVEELQRDISQLGRLSDAVLLSHALSGDATHDSAQPVDNLSDPQRKAQQKIAALLRKSESTDFEDEADALIAKAQQLRQRYRLTDAMEAGAESSTNVIARRVYIDSPWVKHQHTLLSVIARANGCATLLLDDRGISTVFGSDDDVRHVIDLFASLNRQCAWFMDRGPNFDLARRHRQTASYRRSFRLAYAARISQLLHRANSAGQNADASTDDIGTTSPSTYDITSKALPVLARRQAEAEQSRDELFPHLSSMNLSMTNHAGINDGLDAASKSHFGGDSSGLDGRRQIAS